MSRHKWTPVKGPGETHYCEHCGVVRFTNYTGMGHKVVLYGKDQVLKEPKCKSRFKQLKFWSDGKDG